MLLYLIYNMQKTTIQLEKSTAEKLRGVGTMEDTYDTVILKLLEEYMKMKRIDLFVEAQHEKVKKGKFVELG